MTTKKTSTKNGKTVTVITITRAPRHATFDKVKNGYAARNKRAQYVLKSLGKRKGSIVTAAQLKSTVGKGSYVFATVNAGVVTPIKF